MKCMYKRIVAVVTLFAPAWAGANLVVASLNPIMADITRQVGGEHVQVIDLMKPGMDPHTYRPTPEDLRHAEKAQLIVASGKGLEISMDDVRGNLRENQEIFKLGRKVPSLLIDNDNPMFACCPSHSAGQVDPHWYQSIENVIRASRHLSRKLEDLDPEHAEAYRRNAAAYRDRLEKLEDWAKKELSKIPRRDRHLVTGHLAYSYFCEEFGFTAIPLAGLGTEDSPTPSYLSDVVDTIREEHIVVVFPERTSKPSVLEAMVKETGVRVGGYLLSDTPSPDQPTYEAMMRHNIQTILNGFQSE